jgi:hypothetical protein
MTTKTLVTLGTLIAAFAAPALAETAPATSAPIHISACGTSRVSTDNEQRGTPVLAWFSFANTADRVVDRIAFDVERDGRHYLVTDNGSFAPHAKIEHRLMSTQQLPDGDAPASCSVVAVHFSDGTSWMR